MKLTSIYGAFILLLVALVISDCRTIKRDTIEGEAYAKSLCGACHLYPSPELLPKSVWEEMVLPQMGYRLGIYPNDSIRMKLIEKGPGGVNVSKSDIFPESPLVSLETWEKIQNFYLKNAPDSLSMPPSPVITPTLPLFNTRLPGFHLSPPSTTMVHFNPAGGLIVGDANSKRLLWVDTALQMVRAANLAEGIVHIQRDDAGAYLTIMGSFSPTDAALGSVIYLPDHGRRAEILLENLQRPVHSVWSDLNGDGLIDGVLCEFAKYTGGLTLHLRQQDGSFQRSILRNRPGATKCYIRDLNNDGYQDLIALFGQGDEGIFRYINDGKGHFTEEAVLRFPPTWGSSNFRLLDVNNDGAEDIIYTCGDNADYKPILKPYHGVRFYLNDGKGKYNLSFFYPLHGAYDAIPADFDQDGDLDMATLSFFPDYRHQPEAAFVYLENQGNGQYFPRTFPEVCDGRWMVMDMGDLEGDGDIDLLLGPLTFEVVPDRGETARWVKNAIPFVVLENKKR
jgi:hypothetical protein